MLVAILPNGCMIYQDKQAEVRVFNPDQCPDKEFVKYLNCNGLQIQNFQKKECQ